MESLDTQYMRLALEEAKKGLGRTSPNPCVGAVVVNNGSVVGIGYHHKAGTPHAEVHALADAGELSSGATIYVTLEPCNHTGRTPPCSKAVLAAGIKRVVIGMDDPNSEASGGVEFLRSQGVSVKIGVLEDECRQLNYPFIKHSTTGIPWIVMKAGMSLDGRISYKRGAGGAVTGLESKKVVHQLRDRFDAILIGVETALVDNPSLTTRYVENGRDPVRIVLDSTLRLPPTALMLHQKSEAPTWIYCGSKARVERRQKLERAGAVVFTVDFNDAGYLDLGQVVQHLGKKNINSVLVEGGATVHGSFLCNKLVNQVYLFVAPFFIGNAGTPLVNSYCTEGEGNRIFLEHVQQQCVGQDILIQGLMPE